jgi:hypothetical protein
MDFHFENFEKMVTCSSGGCGGKVGAEAMCANTLVINLTALEPTNESSSLIMA